MKYGYGLLQERRMGNYAVTVERDIEAEASVQDCYETKEPVYEVRLLVTVDDDGEPLEDREGWEEMNEEAFFCSSRREAKDVFAYYCYLAEYYSYTNGNGPKPAQELKIVFDPKIGWRLA